MENSCLRIIISSLEGIGAAQWWSPTGVIGHEKNQLIIVVKLRIEFCSSRRVCQDFMPDT